MNPRGILLETQGAWSDPLHWPLRDGERKILTVGSDADWSIPDGALLPVHATLYFDGSSLCVAAAPGALLNGEPLGRDWSPLSLPAQLSLGETKISLASSAQEPGDTESPSELDALKQKTTMMGFPDLEQFRQAALAADRAKAAELHALEMNEGDRITPTGTIQSPIVDPDATQFAVPALGPPLAAAPAPRAGQTVPSSPSGAGPTLAASPARARSALLRSWQGASWPKRLTLLLLPVVLALYTIKAVRQHPGAKRAEPTPSASTARSASGSRALVSSALAGVVAAAPPASVSAPDAHSAGLTLQRRAIDAFATGNFHDAALLYQRLASENPAEPAFAVAARLANEHANGVAHE
jgi:hypothetical protein